ncbi:MAG: diguanylate cyclase [Sulfuritalea sp.]|nr:diguanylate cyclase [Sulfuritalea sp.]
MNQSIRNIWHHAWTSLLVEMSSQEIHWLLSARQHMSLLHKRRTTMIVSRVRLVAALFAILTPLWIIVDIAAFPSEVWVPLVTGRIIATIAFGTITLLAIRMRTMADAYSILAMLFAVPTAFFLFSYQHMANFQLHGIQQAFSTGYAFLPFVMLAGLSIFPLTLLENIIFISPLLLMQLLAGVLRLPVLDWPTFAASFWLMLLIAGVSVLAGVSQLAFIIVLVRESIRDHMTNCFSRQSGEELLELQFANALRCNAPLTVAFLDLDRFKQINDLFGHESGDAVLVSATVAIHQHLRQGDMLIRWGGEEFVLILPNTTPELAQVALQRVVQAGLGLRPDGEPVTASIGIAERIHDHADDWRALVEKADVRMYEAKQSGRNLMVGPGGDAATAQG